MIVAETAHGLRMVTQCDHAHLAGQILALWRTDGLARHPRRADLLFAAREHDNGWREHDAVPHADPRSGRPVDFRAVSGAERRALWQRGVLRHHRSHPYAALLVLAHARALHADRVADAAWQPLLAAWDALDADWRQALGVGAALRDGDYRWIQRSDVVSLALGERWQHPMRSGGLRLEVQPAAKPGEVDTLLLDPFPLVGATTFTLAARTIENRPYRSDAALASALAGARWQQVPLRLAPGR